MKKNFFILFISLTLTAYSQDVSYSRGEEFISKDGTFKNIIGGDKKAFYIMREGNEGREGQYNVEKYNKKTLEREWITDINYESELKIKSAFLYKPLVIIGKEEISFIFDEQGSTKDGRAVYIKSLDIKTGIQKRPIEKFFEEENTRYSLSLSKDTTLLLVSYNYLFRKKVGLAKVNEIYANFMAYSKVKLFDIKNRKEIFTKDLPLNDGERDMGCTFVETDNKGNLLCKYVHTKEEKMLSGQVYEISGVDPGIGKIPVNSTSMTAFDLNPTVNDHAYLVSSVVQYQENYNYAVITGIFVDEKCKGKCERRAGNFFMKIDLNNSKIINKAFEYFDGNAGKVYTDLKDIFGDF
jgi:hypothetical protein